MAADAVTAMTSTAFKDLAETLVRRRLSGLPLLPPAPNLRGY
jgi:hypothetical protein